MPVRDPSCAKSYGFLDFISSRNDLMSAKTFLSVTASSSSQRKSGHFASSTIPTLMPSSLVVICHSTSAMRAFMNPTLSTDGCLIFDENITTVFVSSVWVFPGACLTLYLTLASVSLVGSNSSFSSRFPGRARRQTPHRLLSCHQIGRDAVNRL